MRIATVDYEVYKYAELTEDAKEKVKTWYLEGQEPFIFTEDCKMDLENLFGENDLDVQYSLGYCQGDGFNIYGKIYAESIFKCLENHNGGTQLAKFEDMLTEKEKTKKKYNAWYRSRRSIEAIAIQKCQCVNNNSSNISNVNEQSDRKYNK